MLYAAAKSRAFCEWKGNVGWEDLVNYVTLNFSVRKKSIWGCYITYEHFLEWGENESFFLMEEIFLINWNYTKKLS